MKPLMQAEGINRYFRNGGNTVHALRDVSLQLLPGRLTVLRGRSGSGKTCMINLLGALDKPDTGHVFFDGADITRLSEARRDALRRKQVGFVFQSVALIGQMSAYENVEFGLRVSGFPTAERRTRAEQVLGEVGLLARMKHRPQELSGGEQQRVAIARAIAHKPRVLFADEPTAELDTHMGLTIVKLFKQLATETGLTVVMTTHDPHMQELADDVYTLADGQVVETLHITPLDGEGGVPT